VYICHSCGAVDGSDFGCCPGAVVEVPDKAVTLWEFNGRQVGYVRRDARFNANGQRRNGWGRINRKIVLQKRAAYPKRLATSKPEISG
jgi:hypothetical protein